MYNIINAYETNDIIAKCLNENKTINYMRFGLGYETIIPYNIEKDIDYRSIKEKSHLHSGLYGDEKDFIFYYEQFVDSVKNRDIFLKWNVQWLNNYENYFLEKYKKDCIYTEAGSNESFRFENPFSYHFKDKKILVVNSFKESIDKQFKIKDNLFKDKKVLPDFELITYKSVISYCMEKPHSGWKESYQYMIDDISKIDFDIALVGCGAYSQPIVNFIYSSMNKTALNTAGGTPLYFGILGKRWNNDNFINKVNKEYWIQPIEQKPEKYYMIENGCYW